MLGIQMKKKKKMGGGEGIENGVLFVNFHFSPLSFAKIKCRLSLSRS
jgi:hypothetical protein